MPSGSPPKLNAGFPEPGDVIAGKYTVEAVLGAGSMGVVVRARHKVLGQLVAIKLLKPQVVADKEILARFTREARALVAVKSDHVVRVLDFGTLESGAPYMVMEYLTGRDLLTEMRERDFFATDEIVDYLVQACHGLHDIHAQGVVHRDVKPGNIFLVRSEGAKTKVKIVDFGISKAPHQTEDELTLTQHATAIGSPHYMAPEQVRDAKTVDHRADLWAIGIILYKALTGHTPFDASSLGALFAAVAADPPARLRDERPELPAELEAIILKCLEKDPAARFSSAMELAQALQPFASPRPNRREDVTELRRRGPAAPPPPDMSGAEIRAVSRSDLSGTERTAVVEKEGAPPAPRPNRTLAYVLVAAGAVAAAAVGYTILRRDAHDAGALETASTEASREATTAAPAAPAPTRFTDLPAPKTQSAEAAAAYRIGLQALRDASFIIAVNSFNRAATLDPTMAAAHLRSAINSGWLVAGEIRRHFQSAFALRASLDERDLAILDALEPMYLRPDPDKAEARRRIDALAAERPGDSELLYLTMELFDVERTTGEELEAADRVLAVDPKCAAALWQKAVVYEAIDDIPAALREIDRCLAASPGAASCLHVRAIIQDFLGQCDALEADAQRMLSMETGSYKAHQFLARALFARGYSMDGVKAALVEKEQATPAAARKTTELTDAAHLAVLAGDFAGALRIADDLDRAAAASELDEARAAAALLHTNIEEEVGDVARAGKVADAFLKQQGARPRAETIESDPRPQLLAAAVRGGTRSEAERIAGRDAWLATWGARASKETRGELWLNAFALPARTRADADSALAALPRYAPIHMIMEYSWSPPGLGTVHALAGRRGDAIAALTKAVQACHELDYPFEHSRAELHLGEMLEENGDGAGACTRYADILKRWGNAVPRSVTADEARRRAKALCPK